MEDARIHPLCPDENHRAGVRSKRVVLTALVVAILVLGSPARQSSAQQFIESHPNQAQPAHALAIVPNPFQEYPFAVMTSGQKHGADRTVISWPGHAIADRYYWESVRIVRQRFRMNDTFIPQFVLILHASHNRVCINQINECDGFIALELKHWDRHLFVDGVTHIAIYEIALQEQTIRELSKVARQRADAVVPVEELAQEGKQNAER